MAGNIIGALKQKSGALRRMSIKRRLLISFLITSLLPVLLVAIYSNYRYEVSISDKLSSYSLQVLSESAINAARELQQYETLSESIIINDAVQDGLANFSRMEDYEQNQAITRVKDALGEQVFRLSNVSNVVILTNEGLPFYDLGYEIYPNGQILDSLYDISRAQGNMNWTYLRSNRDSDKIALSRIIYSADNLNEKLGYLVIVIDEQVFTRNTYEHVDLGAGSSLYIVDSKGIVVSSVDPAIPHGVTYAQEGVFANVFGEGAGKTFYASIDGKRKLVGSAYIRSADWYMIGLVPHSYVISELSQLRDSLIYICIVIMVLSGLLAIWIFQSIGNPMRDLLQYATRIKLGHLDTRLEVTHSDEMGKLTETIDQMVVRLKQLIYQVEEEQQAKRDAELKMLQAQINPHFLFNTLNSLKWSAMMSGNEVVEQGISSLSELLRNTILVKEEMIPLEREIENLLHYSVIQRIRYGDSFKLNCRIDDDLLYGCLVPRFILQPIVENSIIHAGGGDGRRVTINVDGTMSEDTLVLRIADDGKGFDMNATPARKHSHDKLSGIGIANVDERIRLFVGEPYGLRTHSRPNEGTETILQLPIIRKEGDSHV